MSTAAQFVDLISERIAQVRAQLTEMRTKQRRLAEAIRQREQHLTRLEASAALGRPTPPVRPHHE